MLKPFSRGISTVIGMALFLIIALALLATIYIVFSNTLDTLRQVANLMSHRMSTTQLASALRGWWILDGSTLVINITNDAPITLEVTAISIVLNNGSYIALYEGHTYSAILTIAYPDGRIETKPLTLPLALGLGYSINISIPGFVNAVPKAVSMALSASPIVITVPIKPYTPIAPKPSAPSVYYTQLRRYGTYGTIAILKKVATAAYTDILGHILQLNVKASSYNGTPQALEKSDPIYFNVTSISVPPSLMLTERNSTVYTDFSLNPFTQPPSPQYLKALSRAVGNAEAAWLWGNYGYSGKGLEYECNLTSMLFGRSIAIGIAYNNQIQLPSTQSWDILVKVYVPSITRRNITGLVAYLDSLLGVSMLEGTNTWSYYFAGIYVSYSLEFGSKSIEYYLMIAKNSSSGFISLTALPLSIGSGWYILEVSYDPINHSIVTRLYDLNGNLIDSISAIDTQYSPRYVGIISINGFRGVFASARLLVFRFDDFIAGIGDVKHLKVIDVPNNYVVSILNSDGTPIYRVSPINGIAAINIIRAPVLHSAYIAIYNGSNEVLREPFEWILGGDTYRYLPQRYEATIKMSTFLNLSDVINNTPRSLYVGIALKTNGTYVNVSLRALNIITNQFEVVANYENVLMINKYVLVRPELYLNSSGIVSIELSVSSNRPFLAAIDLLNAKLHALAFGSSIPALLVGFGNTDYLDIYQVTIYTYGPKLTYLFSIDTHTIFNGSASIAYSEVDRKLYLLNTSGIYYATLIPNASFRQLITNPYCHATNVGAQIVAINVSNNPFLIILPGANNGTLCIVNATSGRAYSVSLTTLIDSIGYGYSVAAYNDTCTWITVINSSLTPQIIEICSSGIRTYLGTGDPAALISKNINIPTAKNIGLGYCASIERLVLLPEGGPSYVIDPQGDIKRSLNPPFYPVGVGDRLGCFNGYAFFVRGDYTNELWIWKVS